MPQLDATAAVDALVSLSHAAPSVAPVAITALLSRLKDESSSKAAPSMDTDASDTCPMILCAAYDALRVYRASATTQQAAELTSRVVGALAEMLLTACRAQACEHGMADARPRAQSPLFGHESLAVVGSLLGLATSAPVSSTSASDFGRSPAGISISTLLREVRALVKQRPGPQPPAFRAAVAASSTTTAHDVTDAEVLANGSAAVTQTGCSSLYAAAALVDALSTAAYASGSCEVSKAVCDGLSELLLGDSVQRMWREAAATPAPPPLPEMVSDITDAACRPLSSTSTDSADSWGSSSGGGRRFGLLRTMRARWRTPQAPPAGTSAAITSAPRTVEPATAGRLRLLGSLMSGLALVCTCEAGGGVAGSAYVTSAGVLLTGTSTALSSPAGWRSLLCPVVWAAMQVLATSLHAAAGNALEQLRRCDARSDASSAAAGARRPLAHQVNAAAGYRTQLRQELISLALTAGTALSAVEASGDVFARTVGGLTRALPALAAAVTPTHLPLWPTPAPAASVCRCPLEAVQTVPERTAAASTEAYRRLWWHLSESGLALAPLLGPWSPEVRHAVRTLAAHSPVLVSAAPAQGGGQADSAGSGAGNSDVGGLASVVSPPAAAAAASALRAVLPPATHAQLLALPPSAVALLRSLLCVEAVRASQGPYAAFTRYLADASLERVFGGLLDVTLDCVFMSAVVEAHASEPASGARTDYLRCQAQVLVTLLVHRYPRVRCAAQRWLTRLLDAFPWLLWDPPLLRWLCDTTAALTPADDLGRGQTCALDVPTDPDVLGLLRDELRWLIHQWMARAFRLCPQATLHGLSACAFSSPNQSPDSFYCAFVMQAARAPGQTPPALPPLSALYRTVWGTAALNTSGDVTRAPRTAAPSALSSPRSADSTGDGQSTAGGGVYSRPGSPRGAGRSVGADRRGSALTQGHRGRGSALFSSLASVRGDAPDGEPTGSLSSDCAFTRVAQARVGLSESSEWCAHLLELTLRWAGTEGELTGDPNQSLVRLADELRSHGAHVDSTTLRFATTLVLAALPGLSEVAPRDAGDAGVRSLLAVVAAIAVRAISDDSAGECLQRVLLLSTQKPSLLASSMRMKAARALASSASCASGDVLAGIKRAVGLLELAYSIADAHSQEEAGFLRHLIGAFTSQAVSAAQQLPRPCVGLVGLVHLAVVAGSSACDCNVQTLGGACVRPAAASETPAYLQFVLRVLQLPTQHLGGHVALPALRLEGSYLVALSRLVAASNIASSGASLSLDADVLQLPSTFPPASTALMDHADGFTALQTAIAASAGGFQASGLAILLQSRAHWAIQPRDGPLPDECAQRGAHGSFEFEPLQFQREDITSLATAQRLRCLARLLLGTELDSVLAWAIPRSLTDPPSAASSASMSAIWERGARAFTVRGVLSALSSAGDFPTPAFASQLVAAAATQGPDIVLSLWLRLRAVLPAVSRPARIFLVQHGEFLSREPDLALELLTSPDAAALITDRWAPASMRCVVQLLSRCSSDGSSAAPPAAALPTLMTYALRSLRAAPPEELSFYLPQLIQALRHDPQGLLAAFLFESAQTSPPLALQLVWALTAESVPDQQPADTLVVHAPAPSTTSDTFAQQHVPVVEPAASAPAQVPGAHGYQGQLFGPDPLPASCCRLLTRLLTSAPPALRVTVALNTAFWDAICFVSARLKMECSDKAARKARVLDLLRDVRTKAEHDALEVLASFRQHLHDSGSGAGMDDDAVCQLISRFPLGGAVGILGGRLPRDLSSSYEQTAESPLVRLPHSLILPTAPLQRVVSVNLGSARPMQSAHKAPYLLTFSVVPTSAGLDSDAAQLLGVALEPSARQRPGPAYSFWTEAISTIARASANARIAASNARAQVDRQRVQLGHDLQNSVRLLPTPAVLRTTLRSPVTDSRSSATRAPPMVSAAIDMATTTVTSLGDSYGSRDTSLILKVFDDCRQDALAVQVMHVLQRAFDEAGLALRLFPYAVVPMRVGHRRAAGGAIAVIPGVHSLDELGKGGYSNLYDFFVAKFGHPDGARFDRARESFKRSCAAYAVFCYLLLVKDRHNGNLLVMDEQGCDEQGAIIHIDFGFLVRVSAESRAR